jgi:hypothetical protein
VYAYTALMAEDERGQITGKVSEKGSGKLMHFAERAAWHS